MTSRALRTVLLVVALGTPFILPGKPDAATADDGKRAFDAHSFTDALGIWTKLAASGDAKAAYGLGMLYDLGNGVPESQSDAFKWYAIAATAGVPQAELNVAIMYDSGRGVARSAKNAAMWYAKAAANGLARAQYNLGILYANGEGVPRNTDLAAVWFEAALQNGVPAAAEQLQQLPPATNRSSPPSPLLPVRLESPRQNGVFTVGEDGRTIELVWTAPPQPARSKFLVQVWTVNDQTMIEFYSATLTQSATLIRVKNDPALYAWNVEVWESDGPRKASGEWGMFSVEPVAHPGNTVSKGGSP